VPQTVNDPARDSLAPQLDPIETRRPNNPVNLVCGCVAGCISIENDQDIDSIDFASAKA